jgi:hypothetical protein
LEATAAAGSRAAKNGDESLMFNQRFPAAAAIAIVSCWLCAPRAFARDIARNATATSADPILTAQLDVPERSLVDTKGRPKAVRLYFHAVRELRRGKAAGAEKQALRAVGMDAGFADADALAATAALAQRQFSRAALEATNAAHIDAQDEKAWVILATADNYLGRYADALEALSHVREEDRSMWQVAYQWARAEAGENDAAQTLDWANCAALTAPAGFAPLHLLRASALLAAGEHALAGDELEIYLRLIGKNAPERDALLRQLVRIRALPAYNALRN